MRKLQERSMYKSLFRWCTKENMENIWHMWQVDEDLWLNVWRYEEKRETKKEMMMMSGEWLLIVSIRGFFLFVRVKGWMLDVNLISQTSFVCRVNIYEVFNIVRDCPFCHIVLKVRKHRSVREFALDPLHVNGNGSVGNG